MGPWRRLVYSSAPMVANSAMNESYAAAVEVAGRVGGGGGGFAPPAAAIVACLGANACVGWVATRAVVSKAPMATSGAALTAILADARAAVEAGAAAAGRLRTSIDVGTNDGLIVACFGPEAGTGAGAAAGAAAAVEVEAAGLAATPMAGSCCWWWCGGGGLAVPVCPLNLFLPGPPPAACSSIQASSALSGFGSSGSSSNLSTRPCFPEEGGGGAGRPPPCDGWGPWG